MQVQGEGEGSRLKDNSYLSPIFSSRVSHANIAALKRLIRSCLFSADSGSGIHSVDDSVLCAAPRFSAPLRLMKSVPIRG